jgi:hypothetical protein
MCLVLKCVDVDGSIVISESTSSSERSRSRLSSPQPGPSNGSGQRSIRQRYGIPLTTIFWKYHLNSITYMYFLMKCMDVDDSSNMLESTPSSEQSRSRLSSPQPGPSNGSCLRSIQQTNRIPSTTFYWNITLGAIEHYKYVFVFQRYGCINCHFGTLDT